MASSDNFPSFEPWLICPADPWFSDAFARDADALTKALTYSISHDSLFDVLNDAVTTPNPATPLSAAPSITISGSGSDPDTASKRTVRRTAPGPAAGRAGKRKSRASKKSPATFITADAENFRQMVQQVTGVKLPAGGVPSMLGSIVKPEPQRLAGVVGRSLPTLDTSAFLLDHHQQVVGHGGAQSGAAAAFGGEEVGPDSVGGSVGSLDFGSFSCFPTLDSWEVL